MSLTYTQTEEILTRLGFIKGNIIADQQRDAIQQLKELIEYVQDIQETIISKPSK